MSLASLVRDEQWTQLEKAWAELLGAAGPIDEAISALDAASEAKQVTRLVPLVREHADVLEALSRPMEAAELLGKALLCGAPPGELTTRLVRNAEAAWGSESWWPVYTTLVGFHGGATDIRKSWRSLRGLIHLEPGSAFFHRSGWGVGEITAVHMDALEVDVRFASGRKDRLPLKSLLDTSDLLEPTDLRALVVRDPAALSKIIKDEPLEPLLSAVRRWNGKLSLAQLKSALTHLGVEGPAFTSWWRKARKLAETSPWFEVTGSGQNVTVRLLESAADPVASVRHQLKMSKDLKAALTRVRDLLSGAKIAPELRQVALETIEWLASQPGEDRTQRISAWLLLRAERNETPPPLAELVRLALAKPIPEDPAEAPALWRLFAEPPGLREQELCLDLLREIYGEEHWLDEAAANVHHAPPGMVRALVDALLEAKRETLLAQVATSLLIRPTRNPNLLLTLAEQVEAGKIDGEYPGPLQRLHSYLLLAVHLQEAVGSDPFRTRAEQRLVSLLTSGQPPLMGRLLDGATRSQLRAFMPLVAKGVPSAIDRAFTHHAVQRYPDIFRDLARPFWEEENTVWTTREGLAKRENELRELREVKIPANAEAIGRAASFGDLSENSEWESALEEQRNLTTRAMEIEEELRRAQLIDNAAAPEGIAAPGTKVRYREVNNGKERMVAILGPWDSDAGGVISYRSPIAQGLLGTREGSRPTLRLPSGNLEVEVLEVTTIPLGVQQKAEAKA